MCSKLWLWTLVILTAACVKCQRNDEADKDSSLVLQTYFSNNEIESFMRSFTSSSKCGSISRMFSIGKSVVGVDLWVLEIALRPGVSEPKPNFKYVANMHGDEASGRQLLLKLAEWLCDNWKSDPKAESIVKGMHLFLMPTMNPDGFALGTRANKNGVDLNRDFPDRFEVEGDVLHPLGNEAIETLAVMDWIDEGFFVGSGNLHEGAVVANYPWDALEATPHPGYAACPDDATFIHLAETYANSHLTMHDSKEFPGGITNGNEWYPVYGSMQDYNYIMGNCMELTLELNERKYPDASQLKVLWQQNKHAFLDFAIAAAFQGFRGIVVGKDEKPLAATIKVKGIEKDYFTRPEFGDFYRPLKPGRYDVTISADGYQNYPTRITIPDNGTGEVYRFELETLNERGSMRTVHAQSFDSPQFSSSWTPNVLVLLLLTVFLIIGILHVRKLSHTRN